LILLLCAEQQRRRTNTLPYPKQASQLGFAIVVLHQ